MNGYAQYKEQSVNTMTKGEMLNLLYDEVVKRLKRSKIALQEEKFEIFESEVERAKEIISYLVSSLNRKYPISANLAQLYDYFNFCLSRAVAGRKEEPIDEVIPFVIELRDSFKEADKRCKQVNVQQEQLSNASMQTQVGV